VRINAVVREQVKDFKLPDRVALGIGLTLQQVEDSAQKQAECQDVP